MRIKNQREYERKFQDSDHSSGDSIEGLSPKQVQKYNSLMSYDINQMIKSSYVQTLKANKVRISPKILEHSLSRQ